MGCGTVFVLQPFLFVISHQNETVNRYRSLVTEAEADGIRKTVVAAAVMRPEDSTVLTLRRPANDFLGGLWELPSGTVEPGESLDEALAREVQEETGLAMEVIDDYLGLFDYFSSTGKPTRQFTFTVTTQAITPVALSEHTAYAWVPIDDNLPVSAEVKAQLVQWKELNG